MFDECWIPCAVVTAVADTFQSRPSTTNDNSQSLVDGCLRRWLNEWWSNEDMQCTYTVLHSLWAWRTHMSAKVLLLLRSSVGRAPFVALTSATTVSPPFTGSVWFFEPTVFFGLVLSASPVFFELLLADWIVLILFGVCVCVCVCGFVELKSGSGSAHGLPGRAFLFPHCAPRQASL